jgi:hypothetical protein
MPATRDDAKAALIEYAGLSDAQARSLLSAVLAAAEREALELVAGGEPVPSSIADARALRLRYISEAAQRALKPREVEVVLRVAPSTALSTIRRMNAMYARAVDPYLKAIVRDTATVTETGDAETGLRYAVFFDEPTGLDYAYQLLQRRGMTHGVRVQRANQTLDLPRDIGGTNPLTLLGLDVPK